jgi:hypothetical protein
LRDIQHPNFNAFQDELDLVCEPKVENYSDNILSSIIAKAEGSNTGKDSAAETLSWIVSRCANRMTLLESSQTCL